MSASRNSFDFLISETNVNSCNACANNFNTYLTSQINVSNIDPSSVCYLPPQLFLTNLSFPSIYQETLQVLLHVNRRHDFRDRNKVWQQFLHVYMCKITPSATIGTPRKRMLQFKFNVHEVSRGSFYCKCNTLHSREEGYLTHVFLSIILEH